MKKSSTAKRLAEYMTIYQKRQIDILEDVKPYCEEFGIKINKSEISQYLSGKFEPGNKKIYVLSIALGVNPLWLMGYDEPMYKVDEQERFKDSIVAQEEKPAEVYDELDHHGANLLTKLTPQEWSRLLDYAELLLAARSKESSPRE